MPITPGNTDKVISVQKLSPSTQNALDEFIRRHEDGMLIYDAGELIGCNASALSMLGYADVSELLGSHPADISPARQPDGSDSREKAEEYLAIAEARGTHRFEWTHKTADGLPIPVEVLLTLVNVDGRALVHGLMRDISEYKALQDQLRHVQKMEAMGKLAGGIAHDFNNFLVVVLGRAELLAQSLADDELNLAHVKEIQLAGERGAALVRQLLTFGRKQPVERAVLDIREAVDEAQALLRPLLGDNIRLITWHPEEPLWVNSDLRQVEQMLMNLARNAQDAMPQGGKLTIHTQAVTLDNEIPAPDESRRYALITITDTGTGMTEEVLDLALDPFFTTKDVGDGTGLGLSTVYGIVTQNGGHIQLKSQPDAGTTVEVYLPLTHPPQVPANAPGRQQAVSPGNETVLLVEDDLAVFQLTNRVLKNAGYQVLSAHNGLEALQVVQNSEKIDLMLCDVVMPRMTGPELYEALSAQGRAPLTLFMSGYAGDSLSEVHKIKDAAILAKPFTPSDLLARVRQLLDLQTRAV